MAGLPTIELVLVNDSGSIAYDISSKMRLADGYTLTRGMQDERPDIQSCAFSATLNNSDGRFTYGSSVIDSPSPITLGRRIRLNLTVNGTTFARYAGDVVAWPAAWPGGKSLAVSAISAADSLARCERHVLRSVIEEEILLDDPTSYYTMGDAAGSTKALDSAGTTQGVSLAVVGSGADVTFGAATGPGTDGLTAVQFAGGKYLAANGVPIGGLGDFSFEFAFLTTATGITLLNLPDLYDGSGPGAVGAVTIDVAGRLAFTGALAPLGTSAAAVNDGQTHVVQVWYTSGIAGEAYVDGTSLGQVNFAAGAGVGRVEVAPGATCTIAHLAFFADDVPTSALSQHRLAMTTGFAGETTDARARRLYSYGISTRMSAAATGLTTQPFEDFTGRTAAEVIRESVVAEGGFAYINGTAGLVCQNRNVAVSKTGPDLTLAAADGIGVDFAPVVDDQGLVNYASATRSGGPEIIVRDAASEARSGRYSASDSYAVATDAEVTDRANWLVRNNASPSVRAGQLVIDMLALTAAQQECVVALEPGAWLRVTGLPSQTPGGTTGDYEVLGFSESLKASEWQITFNVASRDKYQAWLLGDSINGVLGSTTKLYY